MRRFRCSGEMAEKLPRLTIARFMPRLTIAPQKQHRAATTSIDIQEFERISLPSPTPSSRTYLHGRTREVRKLLPDTPSRSYKTVVPANTLLLPVS